MGRYVLALDPSNKATAYVLIDVELFKPIDIGFLEKNLMLDYISLGVKSTIEEYEGGKSDFELHLAIEGMQNLGMPSGKSVFDTCYLIGHFIERAESVSYHNLWTWDYKNVHIIYRKEEKMHICGTMRCKDKDIKQALVDTYAKETPNFGKGTKEEKGYFWGFKADLYQAFAIGVTYHDLYMNKVCKN